jgi:uncharacterized protein (DUF2141 family)
MKSHPTLAAGIAILMAAALGGAPAGARAQGACAGNPSSTKLHVIVQGVRGAQGVMTATLYGDNPALWLKGGGELNVARDDARSPVTEMCFWLPHSGTYAVAVYHDAKRAYRFVRGTFGPTQDYGFSRNPHLFLGPPSMNQVKFPADEGETTIYIRLKYP